MLSSKVVKKEEACKLLTAAEELALPLRRHAIRIGLGRCQHIDISQGGKNINTIVDVFDYRSMESAHRQLEDCRDNIVQELTARRLEKRLSSGPSPKRFKTDNEG